MHISDHPRTLWDDLPRVCVHHPWWSLSAVLVARTCRSDSGGFFKCNGTQSFGGVVVPAVDEGQSIINSDCTGQITYNKGTQQELDINFLILHDGKELRGMLQNTGSAVQCDLIRMSALDDHE